MKLGYARIFVNDLKGAVEFYRDTLGLEPAWHEPGQHAGFKTGDCTLLLEPAHGEAQKLFTGLSFTVNNIEAEHQRLTNQGVEFTQPPTKMEWGGTLAYFKDPERYVIGLVPKS